MCPTLHTCHHSGPSSLVPRDVQNPCLLNWGRHGHSRLQWESDGCVPLGVSLGTLCSGIRVLVHFAQVGLAV